MKRCVSGLKETVHGSLSAGEGPILRKLMHTNGCDMQKKGTQICVSRAEQVRVQLG